MDTLSIPGSSGDGDGSRVPFQGLEQIPKSSVQVENLINFKDMIENYKFLVSEQDGLLQKAIRQNHARIKSQFKLHGSKTLLNSDMVENVRDFINKQNQVQD